MTQLHHTHFNTVLQNSAHLFVYLAYFTAMFLLTADRLAASLLSIRYNSMCTAFRAKVAILFTWFISHLGIPLIFGTLYITCRHDVILNALDYVSKYLVSAFCLLFFLFASTSYIIMFYVFVRSRRSTCQDQQQSVFKMFTRSKFYIAIVLISTFLLLAVIPRLLYCFIHQHDSEPYKIIKYILYIVASISDTTDAFIYIFFYTPVQKLMIKNFRWLFTQCRSSSRNRAVTKESMIPRKRL